MKVWGKWRLYFGTKLFIQHFFFRFSLDFCFNFYFGCFSFTIIHFDLRVHFIYVLGPWIWYRRESPYYRRRERKLSIIHISNTRIIFQIQNNSFLVLMIFTQREKFNWDVFYPLFCWIKCIRGFTLKENIFGLVLCIGLTCWLIEVLL
jgi:hypothetical protein